MPTNANRVRYRLAIAADAPAIAELHVASWRVAYRGSFPDDFLDNDVSDVLANMWAERFADPEREAKTLTILAELHGELAGFAHSIIDEDSTYGTLLDNLHVRRDAQRLGIGRCLMAETADRLAHSDSTSSLYLWVLEANDQARRFYESLGGVGCGEGSSADSHPSLPAVPSLRICWPDLDRLSI